MVPGEGDGGVGGAGGFQRGRVGNHAITPTHYNLFSLHFLVFILLYIYIITYKYIKSILIKDNLLI